MTEEVVNETSTHDFQTAMEGEAWTKETHLTSPIKYSLLFRVIVLFSWAWILRVGWGPQKSGSWDFLSDWINC